MQPTATDQQRRVILEGAHNVRELGGYRTRDGQTTRTGRVYRSDNLHRLTASDQQRLRERAIHTMIDLRRPDELAADPNVFASAADITYLNISLFPVRPSQRIGHLTTTLAGVYRFFLDESQEAIADVLSRIAAIEQGAVLFHCTAGKDRTGLIAALLLSHAGVEDAAIVHDYALTMTYIEPLMPELRAARPPTVSVERYDQLLEARAIYMEQTLDYLTTTYGGASAYLEQIGLTASELDGLRARLLG